MKEKNKSNYVIGILLTLLLFLLIVNQRYVYGIDDEKINENTDDTDQKIVRVGWYNMNGFQNGETIDELYGYNYEYYMELAQYTGWKYEFVFGNWQDCIENMQSGKIDILGGVGYVEYRTEFMTYSDSEQGQGWMVIIADEGDERFVLGDFDAMENKKIGIVASTFRENQLRTFTESRNISFTKVIFENNYEVVEALHSGEIDLAVEYSATSISNVKVIASYFASPFFFTVAKNRKDILNELNNAMTQLKSISPYFDRDLYKKYYGNENSILSLNLSINERKFIENSSEITVFYEKNWFPLSFKNKKGKADGAIIHIFDELASKTGLNFVYKTFDDYEDVMKAYLEDENSILAATNDNFTWEIDNASSLTSPYVKVPGVMIYDSTRNAEFIDIAISKCHNLSNYEVIRRKYNCIKKDDFAEALDSLINKEVDAVISNIYQLEILKDNQRYTKLNYISSEMFSENLAAAVHRKQNTELFTILNKGINSLTDNEIQSYLIGSSKLTRTITLREYIYDNVKIIILIFIATITFVTAIIFLIVKNKANSEYSDKLSISLKNELIAKNELAQSHAAQSEFMARMSHDMRTPMNAIIGMAEFGLEESQDTELKDYFNQIKLSSNYLMGLLNDILDMQKVENDEIVFNPEIVNRDEFINNIMITNKHRADDKNITFILDYNACDSYKYLIFDKMRNGEILNNIITNAIKYTAEGGTVKWKIQCDLVENKNIFLCKSIISDNGVGISKDFQERMFDSFTREENEFSYTEGGTGLGLAIARNLIKLIGGNLKFESELGVGSTFYLDIPTKIPTKEELESYHRNNNRSYKTKISCKKILVCEDIDINFKIVKKILEKIDIEAVSAKNGLIGLEKFKSEDFDLILMDIRMPVMDGLEAARKIRLIDKNIPIIALSANAYIEDIEKSREAGMNKHLSKPIDQDKLYEAIENACKNM